MAKGSSRYVERNPVRAKMVRKAENYPRSSARGHCGLVDDPLLAKPTARNRPAYDLDDITDWSRWLADPDEVRTLAILRRNIDKGLPCGSDRFIRSIEKKAGRPMT